MTKKCNKCLIMKSHSEFHIRGDSNKPRSTCVTCYRIAINSRYIKSDRVKLTIEELQQHKKESLSKFRSTNAYKVKHAYNQSIRRANKINATPNWLSVSQLDYIRIIYELSALLTRQFNTEFHVDHIIPLKGKNVSGLHVPDNLQVMLGSANCSKGNRVYEF